MSSNYVFGTLIPEHFLPYLGLMAVRHTQLTVAVTRSITQLSGLAHSPATAFMSPINAFATRLEILKNLIPIGIEDARDRAKFEVLRREAGNVNTIRSRIIHDLPYSYSPANDEMTFFREEVLTFSPQIKAVPPILVGPKTLQEICDRMALIEIWMGLRFQTDLDGKRTPHPKWLDDTAFPWPERYKSLLSNAVE